MQVLQKLLQHVVKKFVEFEAYNTCKLKHISTLNPIPPRLFSNLFPLGEGRHVSHPVELDTKFFLHQNFSLSGLRVSIADFGFEGPGFKSRWN